MGEKHITTADEAMRMNMSRRMHVVMVLGSSPVVHNRRRTIVWAISPSTWVVKVGGVIIGVEGNTHIKGTNPILRKTDTHSGDPGVLLGPNWGKRVP